MVIINYLSAVLFFLLYIFGICYYIGKEFYLTFHYIYVNNIYIKLHCNIKQNREEV